MTEEEARADLVTVAQNLVQALMGWDKSKAKQWMYTPNPMFGNVAPLSMIIMGRSHKVLAFIEEAIDNDKYVKETRGRFETKNSKSD